MMTKAEQTLAQGLASGFAGMTKLHEVIRGPFTLKATEMVLDSVAYNDHWIVHRLGGGQEIAKSGDQLATRVYAGGIAKPEILSQLNITQDQVIAYLREKLVAHAHETRLHKDITPDPDGNWKYSYHILKDYPDLPLTVGTESILYKGKEVFVHVFLNTPVV